MSNLVQITKDQNGREVVMVRVDKTIKEMMEEKPSSRWDVSYWHPKYDEFLAILLKYYKTTKLDDFMSEGTDGITYGQVGERVYDPNGEIQYLQVSNIRITGIDTNIKFAKIKKDSHNDPNRSRLNNKDLLLLNGGVGSLGRSCVFLGPDQKFNISQDIDRIRLKNGISTFYISIFLNSVYGQTQIERFTKGVSGQTKIGFDHVRSIKIPLLSNEIQDHIEAEYKKMSVYHDKAMEAKKKGDDGKHNENLEIAEKMLKDLIAKTEGVIRGERKDVV